MEKTMTKVKVVKLEDQEVDALLLQKKRDHNMVKLKLVATIAFFAVTLTLLFVGFTSLQDHVWSMFDVR
jgi:hypothetical protein